jgi:hypothetical protein
MVVRPRARSLSGSIQTRIPKSLAPMISTLETPLIRARTSLIRVVAQFEMKSSSKVPSGETMLTIRVMLVAFFSTLTPWRLVSSGRTGSASFTRFWTSTVAMSTSVPTSKVTVMAHWPSAEDFDDM